MGVTLDSDRRGEACDVEIAVDLREGVAHGLLGPMASGEKGHQHKDDEHRKSYRKREDDAPEEWGVATRVGLPDGAAREKNRLGGEWFARSHAVVPRINGAERL